MYERAVCRTEIRGKVGSGGLRYGGKGGLKLAHSKGQGGHYQGYKVARQVGS